jgi:hypothetical protein
LSLIAIAATALAGCAYVVSMRFRATVEPLMVALAAGVLADRGAGRGERPATPSGSTPAP